MLAVVSLGDQHVTIYGPNGPIMQGPVSSGATPNDTPVGIYSVLQKNREHYSNRYDDAAMPFMQRITWTGIALHAGAAARLSGFARLRAPARRISPASCSTRPSSACA